MRLSTAASTILGMASLAVGKSVARRDGHLRGGASADVVKTQVTSIIATDAHLAELARLIGLNRGAGTSINFLWVNLGGGAATTVINTASTVTVTQTVAATAPPAVVTGVDGATTTIADTPTTTVVGTGATHSVTVGGPAGLIFNPPQIQASIGDTVIFTFLSQNHTATQSSFETPCQPLEGGMDSGYQANPNNTVNPPPQVAMQVMVDTPLWFYCRQGNHCGRGMVFSINPTADKTHAQFQALAIQQNGNGAGSAITGNPPPAAADPNPPAPPAASDSTTSLAPLPTTIDAGAGGAVSPPPAASTDIVTGIGQIGENGACVCAVQCSFPGFPAAVQGRDSFGGFGGSVPMNMIQPLRFRA
ncbi:uncharacterized protein CTHT_0008450 [Thermochaetoides thermophila DSM 1495]|uniref:Uncharacterized protein n=1 Tax=Chaetomium thermophilum (strain DSM 1495 / CBS 144.50 / IMI 039719) TaxID=759272 RepID=G0S021_CHATD|nr:hypothetical protein CTHT_0008450 [Thermochaetoides thermophila DSM 1495]EGS23182.1 hypothetical protein CTHT_0008450 [Thermochaetoides thermophila DSM 1495]